LGKCRYIVTSGFPEQVVLLVQNDFPAGLGLGAPLTRRATRQDAPKLAIRIRLIVMPSYADGKQPLSV
jgi:hypothetical protein